MEPQYRVDLNAKKKRGKSRNKSKTKSYKKCKGATRRRKSSPRVCRRLARDRHGRFTGGLARKR